MLSLELELAFSCGQSVQFLRCLDRSNYPGSGQYLGCLRSPPGIQQLYAPSAFRRSPSERKHSHYCVENQMQFKNVFLGQEFLHLNQVYEIVIVKQAKSYTLSSEIVTECKNQCLACWWQLRTWIHDNLCDLTIKSNAGQHSQFLRCFDILRLIHWGFGFSDACLQTSSEHEQCMWHSHGTLNVYLTRSLSVPWEKVS